ncbi:hypothetical protein [Microbacterium jiangjiandongii]|uniref:hypothetical protein n=1 Tax=Microbacterium jiangjiandongii TaxID=3049071 RepID=UPI00214B0E15|nr:hypothetical protein [Microbacterium sp. zg.Y843]MCR2816484.1 hypothetical protein [Microbacterium sp. zg.Y843]
MSDQGWPRVKRIRLTGARFEGGRLPVDSLIELERYQRALRIAAEHEWLRDNPGESLPDDFRESVSLTIERIDDGSADVLLAFEHHQTYERYQEEALDAVDSTIAAAYSSDDSPALPLLVGSADREFRDAISLIGSTLEPEQSIQVYTSQGASPVSITVENRVKAIAELSGVDDFLISPELLAPPLGLERREESLTGRITAVDANSKRFEMETAVGKVHGWYRTFPTMLEDLKEVLNSAAEGPLTRVSGVMQFKQGKPFRFWDAIRVERMQFDDTPWGERLARFAALATGWDEGEGKQISTMSLETAQVILHAIEESGTKLPGVFPTAEGGVLLEWTSLERIRSIEILAGGALQLFTLNRGERVGEHRETRDIGEAIAYAEAGSA